jgi:DNA-binding Lrp family transcriptional regulator
MKAKPSKLVKQTSQAELINLLQSGLPLTKRPFRQLARQLGSGEQEVLAGVKELRRAGLIRRLGGVFDSGKLGYATTLVAFRVRPAHLAAVAKIIAARSEVTHCYRRDDDYNLWFTLHAPSRRVLLSLFRKLAASPGVEDAQELSARKVYKVDVNLKV